MTTEQESRTEAVPGVAHAEGCPTCDGLRRAYAAGHAEATRLALEGVAERVQASLTSEDEVAHGEAYEPSRGGLGVCAYCDDEWPCRTQRGIDRLLALLSTDRETT